MAGFSRKDDGLTSDYRQMFGSVTRKADGVSTSNIAPSLRQIATGLSFFVRYFLAKPKFFRRQKGLLNRPFVPGATKQTQLKARHFEPLIHIQLVDKRTCPQTLGFSDRFSQNFNLGLIWPSFVVRGLNRAKCRPANDD